MIRRRSRVLPLVCSVLCGTVLMPSLAGAAISFVPAEPVPAPAKPDFIKSADVNNDGRADIVGISPASQQIVVLLGESNSSTRFNPATVITFGKKLQRPSLGDLNADGNIDVAVPDDSSHGVWILLGQGNGGFLPPYLVQVGRNPFAVAIANFDSVRNNDLAVVDQRQGRVFILLNDGQTPPQFPSGPDFQIGEGPSAVVASDFNRDGNPDVAALNTGGTRGKDIGVLIFDRLAAGFPVFRPVINYVAATNPKPDDFLESADLNNDGVQDLLLIDRPATTGNRIINVLLARGDGVFLAPKSFEAVCPFFTGGLFCPTTGLAVGDFDRNGNIDLALLLSDPRRFSTTDAMQVYVGRGDGGFVAANVFSVPKKPVGIASGDINADGPPDLTVTTKRELSVQAYINVSTPGQKGNGDVCVLGDECLSGRCTNGRCCATQCFDFEQCNVPGMEGVCVPVTPPSECTVDFDCFGICRDEPSRECLDSSDCNTGDRCEPRGCRNGFCCDPDCSPLEDRCDVPGFEGVCIPKSEIGDECFEDADCQTSFCRDGFCCNEDCENGICDAFGMEGICQPKLPLGDFCGDEDSEPNDALCASGICDFFDLICCNAVCTQDEFCSEDGFCTPFDEPATPTPTTPGGNGTPGNTPGNGTPGNATPTPTPTKGTAGDYCGSNEECNTTFCVNEICCLVPSCEADEHCGLGTGNCEPGTPGPTRTRTPTLRATSTPQPPDCPDGFEPVGSDCVAVSRSGGCSTNDGGGGSSLLFVALLPLALSVGRRWQLRRAAARVRVERR